jgi:hypothetical protein
MGYYNAEEELNEAAEVYSNEQELIAAGVEDTIIMPKNNMTSSGGLENALKGSKSKQGMTSSTTAE